MAYLEPLVEDQWFIASPKLKQFVATVREISDRTTHNRAQTLSALEPYFTQLLAKKGWLPDRFTKPNPEQESVRSFRSGYSNAPCKNEVKSHA
ncbi:MAG: hypothetical protein CLLPBCKN_006034 [Chroococcidiopsis cubana SAG 39.79]|uniref:Uncharacterized protein n=1 Tax=Chroococcidiopsis cubana SAG 39.79 TaxID=388085 RepID=A0AB37UGJ5_9CYAN|nr:hypothetical protein [Chroococcidiopsis cubana]MDZ4876599.1 hypothetical protein [Chroococcidiopsis cubana SAG 39.79]PSB59667.1 hypothetical protein C7B79_28655 [Chroococcidiopsis cubana CCALA 043]RUT10339.1 hypothetical protein DSM107010_43350 [Chroococcidiopsis cubana SAG 39.79]